jgi:hypothetical protein
MNNKLTIEDFAGKILTAQVKDMLYFMTMDAMDLIPRTEADMNKVIDIEATKQVETDIKQEATNE